MQTDPTLTPEASQLLDHLHAERRRSSRQYWLRNLIAAGAIIAALGLSYAYPAAEVETVTQEKVATETQKDNLAAQASTTADTQLALCLAGDEAARKLAETGACELAKSLKEAALSATPEPVPGPEGQPGQPGQRGQAGQAGRGIIGTAIVDGRFKITYSDGQTEDKGVIKGERGAQGRSITGSTIANGRLTLTYSDGTTEDVGQVVGKDGVNGTNGINGRDGADGQPGRGIQSLTAVNNQLMVTYTDGSTATVGPLPAGPPGNDGNPPAGWTVQNPDGSTTTCQRAANFDYSNPYYDCTRSGLLGGG